jgi:hypothetical protein
MKEEVAVRLYIANIELRATITDALTTLNSADIIENITKDVMSRTVPPVTVPTHKIFA